MTLRIDGPETALVLAASDVRAERTLGIAWILDHADEARPVLVARVRDGVPGRQDLWMSLLAEVGGADAEAALEVALARGNEGEADRARVALATLRLRRQGEG